MRKGKKYLVCCFDKIDDCINTLFEWNYTNKTIYNKNCYERKNILNIKINLVDIEQVKLLRKYTFSY